jgi:ribosomal-protein-alanine N-acetyltransferase
MPLQFPLRGDRLDLRPFAASDAAAAHLVYGDPEVMRHVGEGGTTTPERTAQMLAHYAQHQARYGFAFWAVIERGTGELIGDAGLEITAHGVELGYTLARTAWGRGLATEAGRLCVEAADGPLGLRRLVALADVGNPTSSRVLEKLGFVADGVVEAYGRPHRRFLREG